MGQAFQIQVGPMELQVKHQEELTRLIIARIRLGPTPLLTSSKNHGLIRRQCNRHHHGRVKDQDINSSNLGLSNRHGQVLQASNNHGLTRRLVSSNSGLISTLVISNHGLTRQLASRNRGLIKTPVISNIRTLAIISNRGVIRRLDSSNSGLIRQLASIQRGQDSSNNGLIRQLALSSLSGQIPRQDRWLIKHSGQTLGIVIFLNDRRQSPPTGGKMEKTKR